MIFAYSVIVCSICKKDEVNALTTKNFKKTDLINQPRIQTTTQAAAPLSSLTASATMKPHMGQ